MLIKNGQDLKYKHVNNHKSLTKILKQKIHSRLKRFQSSFKKGVINKGRDEKKKKELKPSALKIFTCDCDADPNICLHHPLNQ